MLRAVVAEVEDFSPILPGNAASDYERYLQTDELLALQRTPEEWSHRDELLFMTVHQTSELWLKLAAFEVETAAELVNGGDVAPALRLLRRAHDCMKNVVAALDMLEHMSPWEYTSLIRPKLGHGSGFDSPGFRELRHAAPLLGEAFHRLRRDAGLSCVDLYRQGREHEQLYQLAEALVELDERVTLWRVRHFKVVERIIGGEVVGTQGTPVELLGRLIHKPLYPELWEVRNELTELAKRDE
jgi:tryptophan 2,3-dioxygenase